MLNQIIIYSMYLFAYKELIYTCSKISPKELDTVLQSVDVFLSRMLDCIFAVDGISTEGEDYFFDVPSSFYVLLDEMLNSIKQLTDYVLSGNVNSQILFEKIIRLRYVGTIMREKIAKSEY